MKRRTFISTVTALAGLALAKIKAPVAPRYAPEQVVDSLIDDYEPYVQRITPEDVAGWYRPDMSKDMLVFTDKKVWLSTPDGFKEFKVTYKS